MLTLSCRGLQERCVPGETCDEAIEEPSPDSLTCDLSAFAGSPVGQCIPYVEAGWDTSLVKMAHIQKHLLQCPPSAPHAGLSGEELTVAGEEPRRVIGCSVNPQSTCSSLGWACVPFEDGYPACINQSALVQCPSNYPLRTVVEQDGGESEATVCCRAPKEPG